MGLTKCCCCCNLRTGVQVLAIILLIFNGLSLGGYIYGVFASENDYKAYCVAMIVSQAVSVVANSLLLAGASKKKRSLILPWLVLEMMNVVGLAILMIIICIGVFSADAVGLGIAILVLGLAFHAIYIYIWSMVRGLYVGLGTQSKHDMA